MRRKLERVRFRAVSFHEGVKILHSHAHLTQEQFRKITQGKQRVALVIDYSVCTGKVREWLKRLRMHHYVIWKGVFNEIDHLAESNLFAENGYLYKLHGEWHKLFKFDNQSLHAARRIMQSYESQWSQIEYTDTSISWKTLDEELLQFQAVLDDLTQLQHNIDDIEVLVHNMKLEVRPSNLSKVLLLLLLLLLSSRA